MKTKQTSKKTKLYICVAAVIIILAIAAILFSVLFSKEKRADYKRLSTESYDTVFLSMYPIDNFHEEDFTHWRGMDIVKASYVLPSFSTLKSYMELIGGSGNVVTNMYLGVLPEKVDSGKLAELLQSYPGVHFEIILPNPSLDYWLSLSETECEDKIKTYRDFILPLLQYENMSLYFFGAEEWMISNPDNYCDDFLTSETASLTIMLHSDRDHSYLLTVENAKKELDALSTLIAENRTNPIDYVDASDYSILFLGDSVIGNYSGTTSIPGVVEGLTGAQVFNLGLGGGNATETESGFSLPEMVYTIIHKDMSNLTYDPEQSQYVQLAENLTTYCNAELKENLCFVINYGLNDYFCGYPIASDDPYDIYTYTGALRTSITALQQEYPDAHIILMTPNFTTYFGNGTEYRGDATHVLEDYTNALIALSQELNVELLDNFNELDINEENFFEYLSDGCHPNETGRFLIGQRIAVKLTEIL